MIAVHLIKEEAHLDLSVIKARYYYANDQHGYRLGKVWRAGQRHPENMRRCDFRQALAMDWTEHTNEDEEIWLTAIHAQGGPPLRPSAQSSVDLIKRELGIELSCAGVFVDLDDKKAHAISKTALSEPAFFEEVERLIEPFKGIPGAFYFRTLRGARLGFIFEAPVEVMKAGQVRRYLFQQVQKVIGDHDQIEVDRASLDFPRGFAAPHIYKRGRRITQDQARLWVHDQDMALEHVNYFAQELLSDALAGSAKGDRPEEASSASARQGDGGHDTGSQKKKKEKKTVIWIPEGLAESDLDRTQRYDLFRDVVTKVICKSIRDYQLAYDISCAIDQHLCDGRRKAKGEVKRAVDDGLQFWGEREGTLAPRPPEPAPLDTYPELLPLRRVFPGPTLDDLQPARAILESMGDAPAPIWHGEGVRRYDPDSGIWKMYNKAALSKIYLKLEGAKVANAQGEYRDVSINTNKAKSVVAMIETETRSPLDETPFETAPAGIVLGAHFISAGKLGLNVEPKDPKYYAIHALDYHLSPDLISYWDDEDTGRAPVRPRIFTETFLARSLNREPEPYETAETVKKEIDAKITTIGEWLGLALLGLCTREALALVAFGPGSNGKSVLAELISDLFGAERTSHLAPQSMKERFSRAQLFGKAVNVVSEMPESDLLESDTLKAMISGDAIMVENKNETPFRMKPRAAHFFAANTLPASRDRSHGLWRRLIPIEFHHIFTRNDKDPHLLDKLREEYEILVPWALDLAREYIERAGPKHQDYIDTWRGNWRLETDALSAFVEYKCSEVTSTDDYTPARELWRAFRTYADDVGQTGASKMSLNAFSRALSAQPQIKRIKKRANDVGRSASPIAHFSLKLKIADTASNTDPFKSSYIRRA
jgi:P4 family phage/plasmid primase-like protien